MKNIIYYAYIKIVETISLPKRIAILSLIAVIPWIILFSVKSEAIHVYFFDVGQGDAAMVTTPGNIQILIDIGPPSGDVIAQIASVMPRFDKHIEAIFISHAQIDHGGALSQLLKHYSIGKLYLNDTSFLEKQDIVSTLPEVNAAYQGNRFNIDSYVDLDILWPQEEIDHEFLDPNYRSQIIQVTIGKECILFMGDAEVGSDALVDYGIDWPQCSILKSPHHGSKNAVTSEFIEAVRPAFAVISVGKNSFGHPSEEQIELFKSHSVEVLRTDEVGTIHFSISGGVVSLVE